MQIAIGPEIEDDYHNFEALISPLIIQLVGAMHDTFYVSDSHVLRTHTSPVQIRVMEAGAPPFKQICPERAHGCDSDLTFTPMFHQVEGLVVDSNVTFADLKGTVEGFLHAFFKRRCLLVLDHPTFPLQNPLLKLEAGCVACKGQGCRICGHTGWLEVMGCGMVHPRVLEMSGVDTSKFKGFAFGMGVERLANAQV